MLCFHFMCTYDNMGWVQNSRRSPCHLYRRRHEVVVYELPNVAFNFKAFFVKVDEVILRILRGILYVC